MLSTIKWASLTLLIGYICLLTLLYLFQRNLLYFNAHTRQPAIQHSFEFTPGDITLRGWQLNADRDKALIYYGGNAERIEYNSDWLQTILPDHTIYLVNYRGYGHSEGEPEETALYADALAVFDYVASRHQSVDLLGRSLGTGIATYVAARRDVSRLTLVTPYDSILNIARERYGLFPVDMLLKDRFESWKHVDDIEAQTLVLFAADDNIVPETSTRNLISQFDASRLQAVRISASDHIDILNKPQAIDTIARFLQ